MEARVDKTLAQSCKQTALGKRARERRLVWATRWMPRGRVSEGGEAGSTKVVAHKDSQSVTFPRSYHSAVWHLQGMCHTCMYKRGLTKDKARLSRSGFISPRARAAQRGQDYHD